MRIELFLRWCVGVSHLDGCKDGGAHGEELGRRHVRLALAVDVRL